MSQSRIRILLSLTISYIVVQRLTAYKVTPDTIYSVTSPSSFSQPTEKTSNEKGEVSLIQSESVTPAKMVDEKMTSSIPSTSASSVNPQLTSLIPETPKMPQSKIPTEIPEPQFQRTLDEEGILGDLNPETGEDRDELSPTSAVNKASSTVLDNKPLTVRSTSTDSDTSIRMLDGSRKWDALEFHRSSLNDSSATNSFGQLINLNEPLNAASSDGDSSNSTIFQNSTRKSGTVTTSITTTTTTMIDRTATPSQTTSSATTLATTATVSTDTDSLSTGTDTVSTETTTVSTNTDTVSTETTTVSTNTDTVSTGTDTVSTGTDTVSTDTTTVSTDTTTVSTDTDTMSTDTDTVSTDTATVPTTPTTVSTTSTSALTTNAPTITTIAPTTTTIAPTTTNIAPTTTTEATTTVNPVELCSTKISLSNLELRSPISPPVYKHNQEVWAFLPPKTFGILAGPSVKFFQSICLRTSVSYLVNRTSLKESCDTTAYSVPFGQMLDLPTDLLIVNTSLFHRFVLPCLLPRPKNELSLKGKKNWELFIVDPFYSLPDNSSVDESDWTSPFFIPLKLAASLAQIPARNIGLQFHLGQYGFGMDSITVLPKQSEILWVQDKFESEGPQHAAAHFGYEVGEGILVGDAIDGTPPSLSSKNPVKLLPIINPPIECFSEKANSNPPSKTLAFGVKMLTGCLWNFEFPLADRTLGCERIQKKLMELVWDLSPQLVGIYGNSDSNMTNEWIPVSPVPPVPVNWIEDPVVQENGCGYVISGVKLTVHYRYLGPVSHRQATIQRVLYEPIQGPTIYCEDSGPVCRLSHWLTVSSQFLDVSSTPEPMFVSPLEFPPLDLRLPHDFFYPFFMRSRSSSLSTFWAIIVIILLGLKSFQV